MLMIRLRDRVNNKLYVHDDDRVQMRNEGPGGFDVYTYVCTNLDIKLNYDEMFVYIWKYEVALHVRLVLDLVNFVYLIQNIFISYCFFLLIRLSILFYSLFLFFKLCHSS